MASNSLGMETLRNMVKEFDEYYNETICKTCKDSKNLEARTERVAILATCKLCGKYGSLYCVRLKKESEGKK